MWPLKHNAEIFFAEAIKKDLDFMSTKERTIRLYFSFEMIEVPDIQISDEMKETVEIAHASIAMMADEEQLDVLAGKGSNRLNSVQKI